MCVLRFLRHTALNPGHMKNTVIKLYRIGFRFISETGLRLVHSSFPRVLQNSSEELQLASTSQAILSRELDHVGV